MKLTKKQLATLISETAATLYEHIDIIKVYTEDNERRICFALYTYNVEDENVSDNYRIAFCDEYKNESVLLEDYIAAINNDNIDDDDEFIDSTLVSESFQYIGDYTRKDFIKELARYIQDFDVKLLTSKDMLSPDIPDGYYMFILDSTVKNFKSRAQGVLMSCVDEMFTNV